MAGIKTLVRLSNDSKNTNARWMASCSVGDAILLECGVDIIELFGTFGVCVRRDNCLSNF